MDTFHISSVQMGHSMEYGPDEDQKKVIRGMKMLPMNDEHPVPLQSGKIIYVFCAPTGGREDLPLMGSSHGLAFIPNHRDRPHVSVGL